MRTDQTVAEMAEEVLLRQAKTRAEQTGESLAKALEAVLETEAGRQLRELGGGPHRYKRAQEWQEDLVRERAQERKHKRAEERKREQDAAAWERFMQAELRELELRKGGQLASLLGEPLPGEPPAELERLASEDRRQAEEGLVALMRGGKVSYKRLDELTPEDRPARIAANRLREAWLKQRQDVWLGDEEGFL